jgi:hypothetical protein
MQGAAGAGAIATWVVVALVLLAPAALRTAV